LKRAWSLRALAALLVAAVCAIWPFGEPVAQVDVPPMQPLPIAIATTARLIDVARIQENIGEFSATIELTFQWSDMRQQFDPVREGRYRREFFGRAAQQELEKVWNPAPQMRNIVGAPRSEDTSLAIESSGRITLVRTLDATFRMAIDMSNFPFDELDLPFEIVSARFPERFVVFVNRADSQGMTSINRTPRATGWTLANITFRNSIFTASNGDPRSLLKATVAADRQWKQISLRIFVPFFMIMLASLFVLLSPDTNYFSKGTMIFSAMLALVALNFTLEGSFPGSLSLPTPVSSILTSGFFYLAAALGLNVIVMNPDSKWARKNVLLATEVRSIIKWVAPVMILIYWAALILRAMLG